MYEVIFSQKLMVSGLFSNFLVWVEILLEILCILFQLLNFRRLWFLTDIIFPLTFCSYFFFLKSAWSKFAQQKQNTYIYIALCTHSSPPPHWHITDKHCINLRYTTIFDIRIYYKMTTIISFVNINYLILLQIFSRWELWRCTFITTFKHTI